VLREPTSHRQGRARLRAVRHAQCDPELVAGEDARAKREAVDSGAGEPSVKRGENWMLLVIVFIIAWLIVGLVVSSL
jgi:hypothetical protein